MAPYRKFGVPVSLSGSEIASLLSQASLPVASSLAEQLSTYLTLLLKWNTRTNLTAIRKPREIVLRHFADSLFCAQHVSPGTQTLLDFGSGAGFPGIPIALSRPDIQVTLAESQSRKAAFLRESVRALSLNTTIWAKRVEAIPANQLYDAITLRAVDQMESACRTALPRLSPHGQLLIFTTDRLLNTHLAAIPSLDWQKPSHLPHSDHGLLLSGNR